MMETPFLEACKDKCEYCFLNYSQKISEIPVFKGISEQNIKLLIRNTFHQVKSFKKGDMILQSGAVCNYLYILVKGEVVAEMIDLSGKVLKIENLQAPETIASAFIFSDNATSPVTVTACDEVKIMIIPREDFLHLLQKEKQILSNYLNIVANRAQFLSNKLHIMSFKTIKAKLAHYILEKSVQTTVFKLEMTQQELANYFGVERPSISRVLGDFVNESLIKLEKKHVTVLNRKELCNLVE